MRRNHSSFVPSSSRMLAVVGAGLVSLCAATAVAAEPTTTTTEVTAPAGSPVVVVNNTTTPAAAAPAAPASPAWVVPVEPAPAAAAPAPSSHIAVDLYPHPIAPPSIEQQQYNRKVSEVSRARGLRIAGWSMLGSSYMFSALIGAVTLDVAWDARSHNFGTWMTIPVAGPFAAAFNSRSATGAFFATSLGLVQAAGLTMAIAGGIRHRRLKRELTLIAMPSQGGGQVGMAMRF